MHECIPCVPGILLKTLAMYQVYVCLEVCDYRVVSLYDDESERVLDANGWKNSLIKAHTRGGVEHMVEVAAKRRLLLVTSVTPYLLQ